MHTIYFLGCNSSSFFTFLSFITSQFTYLNYKYFVTFGKQNMFLIVDNQGNENSSLCSALARFIFKPKFIWPHRVTALGEFFFIFQVSYQSLQILINSKLFEFWQSDARMFPQLGIRKIVFQVSTQSKENYKITFLYITNAALTVKY